MLSIFALYNQRKRQAKCKVIFEQFFTIPLNLLITHIVLNPTYVLGDLFQHLAILKKR